MVPQPLPYAWSKAELWKHCTTTLLAKFSDPSGPHGFKRCLLEKREASAVNQQMLKLGPEIYYFVSLFV